MKPHQILALCITSFILFFATPSLLAQTESNQKISINDSNISKITGVSSDTVVVKQEVSLHEKDPKIHKMLTSTVMDQTTTQKVYMALEEAIKQYALKDKEHTSFYEYNLSDYLSYRSFDKKTEKDFAELYNSIVAKDFPKQPHIDTASPDFHTEEVMYAEASGYMKIFGISWSDGKNIFCFPCLYGLSLYYWGVSKEFNSLHQDLK